MRRLNRGAVRQQMAGSPARVSAPRPRRVPDQRRSGINPGSIAPESGAALPTGRTGALDAEQVLPASLSTQRWAGTQWPITLRLQRRN